MKRFYTVFVAICWLTMMGVLFNKEVLPAFIITNPSGYKIELTKDIPMRESWMGIYFKAKKIGFSNTVISQDVDSGIAGYRINETTLLRLNLLGEDRFIRIRGGSFFSENYELKNFYYKLISGSYKIDISGEIVDNLLKINVDTGAGKRETSLAIRNNTLISNSIAPFLLFKRLDADKELNFEIFEPVSMSANKVSVKKIGSEAVDSGGNKIETDIFEINCYGIKTRTWMTGNGDILKEESGLGFTMLKENAKDAVDINNSFSRHGGDLLSEFSLKSNIEIKDPRDVSYLKIERDNVYQEIIRDIEPEAQKILNIPIENIPEEQFIESKDDRIIKLAREIVGTEKNSWLAAKKILKWIHSNIRKVPTLSIPSALDVLVSREGDCNEHTVLFTALTRSLGIPTKMVAGLIYMEGSFYYHAWPKVYVGKWINVDPTLGQEMSDATHIPLVEGGIKEQIELIKIISDLKIEVLDYK
ncbi:MAG: hypothetical protein AUJ70_05140 [Candidatus Omnitrophica bacterium CG1_02_40_15]|nr:MAG: hypothetical protein AUJ70_05140 [Candidatus Omnitrophica bacterium CG1_02_40_15]